MTYRSIAGNTHQTSAEVDNVSNHRIFLTLLKPGRERERGTRDRPTRDRRKIKERSVTIHVDRWTNWTTNNNTF